MNKVGRPKRTFDGEKHKLPKNWKEIILDLAKKGGVEVEYKAIFFDWIGFISNDLWDRWKLEEEEFSETLKVARVYSAAWYHEAGRVGIGMGRNFNAVTFIFAACNAHPEYFKRNVEQLAPPVDDKNVQVIGFGEVELKINEAN